MKGELLAVERKGYLYRKEREHRRKRDSNRVESIQGVFTGAC
jgi:hypothetical protein